MTLEKPLTKKQRQWLRLFDQLDKRLTMPIDAFRSLGSVVETKDGPLIYIDRGSPILGVAHLDTVANGPLPKPRWLNVPDGFPVVNSIALDDRLGAWVLLDLLPSLGLTFDVILCDSEERGRSTAESFQPTRKYNWGFEFDRAGTDTVLYDYEDSEEWWNTLEDYGFLIGIGSFSDISCLTSLGCCFANFGVGYHHQHTSNCYADLCETHYMVSLFVDFFKENADNRFEFEKPVYDRRAWYWPPVPMAYKKRGQLLETNNEQERCDKCGAYLDFYGDCDRCDGVHGHAKCSWCENTLDFSGVCTECGREHDLREEEVIICPWCDGIEWDEAGVCENCGYDLVMDDAARWR